MAATRDGLEAVLREQLTRCVANALQSGVPSSGIMNRATEEILSAAAPMHALTIEMGNLCGEPSSSPYGGRASSSPEQVTCEACKRAGREVA